jgi:Cys-tRNA synthase (O-phospho-L-seryl-tRNA:Cys-tRNA synthase)
MMDDFYDQELQKALDHAQQNDNCENSLFTKTKHEIDQVKREVILDLNANAQLNTTDILTKLDEYQYIDEIDEFKSGSFLRWINLESNIPLLTRGAYFCNVSITEQGCALVCRSGHRFFQVKMDTCVVFQKLTFQEQILMNAIANFQEENENEKYNS